MRPSARLLIAKISLSITSLAVFIILVEIGLQVLLPIVFRPRFTRIDSELGWHHNPSVSAPDEVEGHSFQLSYNSRGYRGPAPPTEFDEDTLRVLVIGDSYVDAAEVGDDEVFTTLLESCLPGVDVYNLGVYGYSTAQERLLLEREGLEYRPDLVLLISITNDYSGNVIALESFGPAPRYLLDGDGLRLESRSHPAARRAFMATNIPAPAWIHANSVLYHILNSYFYQPLIEDRIERVRAERGAVHSAAERQELYKRLVLAMEKWSQDAGASFLVTWGYLRSELIDNETSPNLEIREALEIDGVQTVDLFESMQGLEEKGPTLFYREDIHWNGHGNRVVANLLAGVIERWQSGRPLEASDQKRSPCSP